MIFNVRKMGKSLITIGFSSHRMEVIPFAKRLMENHDVIIIEEDPNPKFITMLNQKISKEEIAPSRSEKTPHIKDEIRAIVLVNKLTLTQCEELYRKIRFRDRHQALEIIQDYISSSSQ